MRHALVLLMLALMLALPPLAAAQSTTLAPSQVLQCLTPFVAERAALVYPPDALKRGEGGIVRAELWFEHPERAPDVKILGQPLTAFEQTVRDYLRRYRLPCLQAGQHATLTQEFSFEPGGGRNVMWTRPRDASDAGRSAFLRCVTPGPRPDYPARALQMEQQGIVVVRATFSDGQNAPRVEVLDDTPGASLIRAALGAAGQMRMPCHPGQGPESVDVQYRFIIDGVQRWILRDMPLVDFLASVKDIRQAQVYFDFKGMKCPFELRVRMRQPTADNDIGEIGEAVPERAFFLDWLSRQRLVLTAKQQNQVIGQSFGVSVPCTVLKLGTTSGGGASQ